MVSVRNGLACLSLLKANIHSFLIEMWSCITDPWLALNYLFDVIFIMVFFNHMKEKLFKN